MRLWGIEGSSEGSGLALSIYRDCLNPNPPPSRCHSKAPRGIWGGDSELDNMSRRKKASPQPIRDALDQFVKDARSSSEAEFPSLVIRLRTLVEMPEGNAEDLLNEIRDCRCTSQTCKHPCTQRDWACNGEECTKPIGYCEDCFAFTDDVFTFCHCGQTIMPSHNLSKELAI